MIAAASKYATIAGNGACPPQTPAFPKAAPVLTTAGAAFNIITNKARTSTPDDFLLWWKRELRTGGELCNYIEREKHRTRDRYRAVARKQSTFKQNNKSEVRRVADIPLRDYFRWLKEDPDFWKDDKNLKSLKRDNPDVCVYI